MKKRANHIKKWLLYLLLSGIALTTVLPFIWMVLASFKPMAEIESINPIPSSWHPENYPAVFEQIRFARYYVNSFFVACWVTFLQLMTSAMAAYAFSRIEWKGRDSVFKLYLATMMIPGVVTMIPNYALMVKMGMLDTYAGLIIPAAFSAFGTFLLRQFMLGVPASLDDAAEIDGANHWQIFWNVIMPMARPGLITLGIFTFLANYQSFFWPLIMLKSDHLRTLPIGMLYFDSAFGKQTNVLMAASLMCIAPLIALFVAAQKFIVKGIQMGGVKG